MRFIQRADVGDERFLIPGQTCWRVDNADRFACIIDAADYFYHVKAAMLQAQHRIMLIAWDFDNRMLFERGGKTLPGPNQLGGFLHWMVQERPALEICVLKSNLRMVPALQAIWRGVTPVTVVNWFSSEKIQFAVDGAHPPGAVHHQKIAVIDDVMAFCGGIDLTVGRWDTPEHRDRHPFRRTLGRSYGPRHEVAAAVDGAAARSLGDQARARWQTATGRSKAPVDGAEAIWPADLEPTVRNVDVGIARTLPELNRRREVREAEALNLAAIAAARHTIFIENQYLAARRMADALATRLKEEDGPEVVIVLPRRGTNRIEQETMDSARHLLIHVLWAADDRGRLGVYWPVTDGGAPIYVHSKVLVIDDLLLRVGSSNFNNRSLGFDSECDLAVEADAKSSQDKDLRRTIVSVRDQLISEHLGVSVDWFQREMDRHGSFLQAVEASLGEGRTLRRFTEQTVAGEAGPLAESELVDPDHVPPSLSRTVQRLIGSRVRRN